MRSKAPGRSRPTSLTSCTTRLPTVGCALAWASAADLVPKLWEETPAEFGKRLADCAKAVNDTCDVDGLCRDFSKRLCELKKNKGDRLSY